MLCQVCRENEPLCAACADRRACREHEARVAEAKAAFLSASVRLREAEKAVEAAYMRRRNERPPEVLAVGRARDAFNAAFEAYEKAVRS